MPTPVVVALTGLGICGVALLGLGMTAVILGGSTLIGVGGVLGVAELIVVGRVIERRQWARIAAITLALLQTALAVGLLFEGYATAVILIPIAGLVVVPLSTEAVEPYFAGRPQ
jgi:hypothetical protein